MAKKIRISGYIGLDTTTAAILQQLKDAAGEDIDIFVASIGGNVFEGFEIFNAIKDYKKEFPGAAIYIVVKGVAASMASYVTMVKAYVNGISAAERNASMMIHNPWNLAMGDYREMEKNAEFLKGLTGLMAEAYIRQTGKTAKEMAAIMDAETWLFGQEIKDAGFVDEMIDSEEPDQTTDKASAVAAAKLQFQQAQVRAKELRPDPEKVAAVMRQVLPPVVQTNVDDKTKKIPAVGGKSSTPERGKRGKAVENLKELQTEHPDIYAEAIAAGVKQEQERVATLSAMKKDKRYEKYPAVIAVLDECINTPGKTTTDANALIVAVLSSPSAHAAAESPGPIGTGSVDTPTGEKPNGAAGKADEKPAWKPGQAEEV